MQQLPVLLIPEKTDIEFEQVFAAWLTRGGTIRRLGKYWIKDAELARQQIAIYGNQTFALVLAQIYQVQLISCDDTLIARLDPKWVKRMIQLAHIEKLKESDFPAFIKPAIPKLFLSGVFKNLTDFKVATNGLSASEEILVSTIVDVEAEARSYVLDGSIRDIALYEGFAQIETGKQFLTEFLEHQKADLPKVVIIDIAYSNKAGWFLLEFNSCWGAGLNNCSADKVIDCIIGATVNE